MKLSTTDENSPYKNFSDFYKTTSGYVYLTDSPLAALEFATKNWLTTEKSKGSELLVVFGVNVDEKFLQTDEDEKKIMSALNFSQKFYQYSKDIDLNTQLEKIAFFNFSSYASCCEFLDKPENKEIIDWRTTLDTPEIWNGDSKTMNRKILYS